MNLNFTQQDLNELETMEQAWDGNELKIDHEHMRVWLTHPENKQYNGDYVIESRTPTGGWKQEPKWFA